MLGCSCGSNWTDCLFEEFNYIELIVTNYILKVFVDIKQYFTCAVAVCTAIY